MIEYPDVMIDLETMGNGPSAAITAIGAVEFNVEVGTLGRRFYDIVDLKSSVAAGGTMDVSTVLWWLQQSDEARAEFTRPGNWINLVLARFSSWSQNGVKVWGNGAAFDNVVLRSAYERLEISTPWDFRNDRCFRTVKALSPIVEIPDEEVAHNALSDARWQARYLIELHKIYEGTA